MANDAALWEFVARQNIDHYERLLQTPLTDPERDFIRRRLAEEKHSLQQAVMRGNNVAKTIRAVASKVILFALLAPNVVYCVTWASGLID